MGAKTKDAGKISMQVEGVTKSHGGGGKLKNQKDSAKASHSKSASKVPASLTSTYIELDTSPPDNRVVNSKSLCVYRPELLAFLDFKSLSDVGLSDSNTDFYKARCSKRKAQLESATLALEDAMNADYDNFLVAQTQYESSLAAASAEISLLKITYMFKVYAMLGPSFSSFIDFYEFDPSEFLGSQSADVSHIGKTFLEYMQNTMGWGDEPTAKKYLDLVRKHGKDGTLFLQFINDLSFSCALATPKNALSSNRWGATGTIQKLDELLKSDQSTLIINNFGQEGTDGEPSINKSFTGFIKICRDLTASSQLGRIIQADGDEDETLKANLEKYVDSDFFTSTVRMNPSIFKTVVGWDPYAKAYKKPTGYFAGQQYYHYVPDFKSISVGILSRIFSIDQRSLLLSTDGDEYQSSETKSDGTYSTSTLSGVEEIVETGFSDSSGINLGAYESQITKLQDNLEDTAEIFKQLFRLLDKRGSILGSAGISSSAHPTSPLNMQAVILEMMNNRYWKKFPTYLGLNPSLLKSTSGDFTVNSEEFYKCWGIHFMINFPDISKEIIARFVEDYQKGFLTFSENAKIEEVTVTDSHGDETVYEVDKRDNVLPGTSVSTDLSGAKGGLYTYLQHLHEELKEERNISKDLTPTDPTGSNWKLGDLLYFSDMSQGTVPIWQPLSPTKAFTGTLASEQIQASRTENAFNAGSLDSPVTGTEYVEEDAKILYAYQQASCMWIKPGGDGNETVYPAGIIPTAGCIIDAVIHVLYSCLAPILDIESLGDSEAAFPAVESLHPPYHTQEFIDINYYTTGLDIKYPAGFGSFTDVNTSLWVPVLNAMANVLTRSEDGTMIFSGSPLETIIGGVVDAIASAGTESSNKLGVSSNFGNMKGSPSGLWCTRTGQYTNENQIPSMPTPSSVEAAKMLTSYNAIAGGETDKALALADLWQGGSDASYQNQLMYTSVTYSGTEGGIYVQSSGQGIYLFANLREIQSEDYLKSFEVNSGGMNNMIGAMMGYATPSQFLDKLTTTYNPKTSVQNYLDVLQKSWWSEDELAGVMAILAELSGLNVLIDLAGGTDTNLPESLEGVVNWMELIKNYAAGILTIKDVRDILETYYSVLSKAIIENTDYYAPPEIWFLINLMGTESSSPMSDLLELDIDTISTSILNGTLSLQTVDVEPSSYWQDDLAHGNSSLFNFWSEAAVKLSQARDEDLRLGLAFDLLQKYAERIKNYAETAIDGLTTEDDSDPSALEVLLGELSETTPGRDILANLTPDQLKLKTASLERQAADSDKAYISKSEIFSDGDWTALEILLSTRPLMSDEGRNIKTSVIGITPTLLTKIVSNNCSYSGPENSFINADYPVSGHNSPLIGIKAAARMPDYPIFDLVPKIFRFDTELFVLPGAFDDIDFKQIKNWEDLVMNTRFTRYRYVVDEGSPGTAEPIVTVDLTESEILLELDDTTYFDIYSNTLASYLLEKYYKLIAGVGMNEDDFCTAGTGLEIPINEYAIDFASALGSIYSDLESGIESSKIDEVFMPSEDIESISYNTLNPSAAQNASVSTYSNLISEFSTEIASGEFGEVESSLFESFTNAASSRLFSAESMRDKILGAKYFDRVFYILVDPDEFLIASVDKLTEEYDGKHTPTNQFKSVYTEMQLKLLGSGDFKVVKYYDDSKTPEYLKLVKRKDEGHMSFGSVFFTLVREDASSAKDYGSYGIQLRADSKGDEMIAESGLINGYINVTI